MFDWDFGNVKPNVLNAIMIFAIVAITVPLAKYATAAAAQAGIPGAGSLAGLIHAI